MKPGIILDQKIAMDIMGWRQIPLPAHYDTEYGLTWMWNKREGCFRHEIQTVPRFSHEVEYAFEVAEKAELFKDHFLHKNYKGEWEVSDIRLLEKYVGETPAHAICLAVLRIKNE